MKTWPERNHTPPAQQRGSCTCSSGSSPQLSGLNNSSMTVRAQSRCRETYAATGPGELPTHRVLGLHDGFPRPPAEEPVGARWRGLWGSRQCNTGPSALLEQRGRSLAEFTLQETRWGAGRWKKRRATSNIWHLLSIPPLQLAASRKHTVA